MKSRLVEIATAAEMNAHQESDFGCFLSGMWCMYVLLRQAGIVPETLDGLHGRTMFPILVELYDTFLSARTKMAMHAQDCPDCKRRSVLTAFVEKVANARRSEPN